ncbi:hypothetical protein CsSME_00043537 [Camellia sinensis var. sinensis]
MIAKTLKATLKRGSSSVSMEMEIDPPKKPEVGAEAIKNDDFFNAAENGDSSFFEALSHDQLLKALSLRNEDCRSLLHVAASSAHPKVVKILSAADPSATGINSADEEGWAPLHSASSSGNVEIVEILLSSDCINVSDGLLASPEHSLRAVALVIVRILRLASLLILCSVLYLQYANFCEVLRVVKGVRMLDDY